MEAANIITFNLRTWKSVESFEESDKWVKASIVPMIMSTGDMVATENFFPVEEKSTLPQQFIINYFKDFENYFRYFRSAERDAYIKDQQNWVDKFYLTRISVYFIIVRFTNKQVLPIEKGEIVDKDTHYKEFTKDKAPVLLLKGLELSSDDWEKYDKWFNEWGYDVYIPMLLKVPGMIEYTRCWLSPVSMGAPKPSNMTNAEFPQDLSLIYFTNLKAYQNFLKSKELAVFNQNLHNAFSDGLKYKWDEAFRLTRHWSK